MPERGKIITENINSFKNDKVLEELSHFTYVAKYI